MRSLPSADMLRVHARIIEHHVDAAGDQIHHRIDRLVADEIDIGLRGRLEDQVEQLMRRACARFAEVQLAGIGARVVDKLLAGSCAGTSLLTTTTMGDSITMLIGTNLVGS